MPPHGSELFAPPSPKPYAAASSSSSYMEASSFPLIGDYIGVESCVDYGEPPDPGGDLPPAEPERGPGWRREATGRRRRRRGREARREYPPPIPLLARTGNLPSHMPWVLRRQYTSDGRLILTEEKVRHHEYFRARRANGRLTLHLVPLDGDDPCLSTIMDEEEEEEEEQDEEEQEEEQEDEEEILNAEAEVTIADDPEYHDDDNDDRQGEVGDCGDEEEEDCAKLAASIAGLTVESGGGMGKCSNYNGINVSPNSSCLLGVPVPALRPVHS
ncbi:hypothetical protein ACJRO7_022721 [Eucalyptus globulus]|uniref:FAF domain-containing protein n=1 Tax=Eucalyptus globulus TaxID=34317 RepID=A0ABD3K5B3_EUCGL